MVGLGFRVLGRYIYAAAGRPSCFSIWAFHGFHVDMTGICLCMDMDMVIFGICLSIF
jgi:hypothetical protein